MCQIFGYSGNVPIQLNDMLKEFYSHSTEHPNGWGLAMLSGTHANIEREKQPAYKSAYLKGRLEEPIREQYLLAHIRYATIGNIERKNCHPFTGFDADGRRWTLIHNGTVFDYPPLVEYVGRQMGETDSERILLYLIDRINLKRKSMEHPLSKEERFAVVAETIADMAKGNKLNLLIFDGELMYVHTNLDGTLHLHQGEYGTVFSTEPLVNCSILYGEGNRTEKHLRSIDWQRVPLTRVLAYQDGICFCEGEAHGQVYQEDPEAESMLYWNFSSL